MRAFYNEIDRYCCDWLQNLMDAGLITPGKIDDRSIADLNPDDLRGYERFPLAHGLSARVGRLRAAGNAITPQCAAEFIKASMTSQETP